MSERVKGRVTIALPLYRRFEYVPRVIASAMAQDHDDLEFLFSDNGENGPELEALVREHCTRPFRFRRNPRSVPLTEHLNQLAAEATGEYFAVLSDDDEISPNWVSALLDAIEAVPGTAVALPRVTDMDREGNRRFRSERAQVPPSIMTDLEFIQAWCGGGYAFRCFLTNLSRTEEVLRVGGYPHLWKGNSVDNALLVKLVLGRKVAYVDDAVFYYRVYQESTGLAVSHEELARALNGFLDFLDRDSHLAAFGRSDPADWRTARAALRNMTWRTYRHRWRTMYRHRLSTPRWIRAAFALRFVPAYYGEVLVYLARHGLSATRRRLLGVGRSGNGGGD